MQRIDFEKVVLRNIITNEKYMRKVLPFIQKEYFNGVYSKLFLVLVELVAKYNKLPSEESFVLSVQELNLTPEMERHAQDIVPDIFVPKDENEEWLLDETENWCQERAVHNAVFESIDIIGGKNSELSKNSIPDLLQKALAVSFDTNVGHDYLVNVEERYDFYHEQEERIPFDLEYLNAITKGGLPNKTLNIALAGTGVGKSLFMCHHAASCLSLGHNVLYITMEMAEERIAERIDANLMNVPIDRLDTMDKGTFMSKVSAIQSKTNGKLIIKEYPTGQAHTGHFRALLNELKLKKNFTPQIVFIDYLNICASSRMKGMGGSINSYSYIKAIAEELRGLAVEFNLPIFSATQTTRSGFGNSDPGLEDTSESFGLPATADLMIALISNDELAALNQMMVKQLKNRYNDPNHNKRFIIGVDRSRMKLYDVEQEEQTLTQEEDTGPAFDKSRSGARINSEKLVGIKF